MEAYSIIAAAVLMIVIWLSWMAWESRRAVVTETDTVRAALERRGCSEIDIRRVPDAGTGLHTYEVAYTDANSVRLQAACLVSGGHMFWSEQEPPRAGRLLKGG
jgi:hypothetical protein